MFKVSCPIPEEAVEAIEVMLCEEVRCNWSIFNVRPHEPFFLIGYFQDRNSLEVSYAALQQAFSFLPTTPEISEIEDREWQEAYKAYIEPWSTRGLHWVPVWEQSTYTIPDGEHAVYLDAGMAFGTGSHETTRLMAKRLIDYKHAHQETSWQTAQVIDAGCGSGILALSASILGFATVYAFDRDPEAIRVSQENAEANGVQSSTIEFREAGIEAGLSGRKADLLLANIQADVLRIHADSFLEAMSPGSWLCLSGILGIEKDAVQTVFENKAHAINRTFKVDGRVDGEWADLCFQFNN